MVNFSIASISKFCVNRHVFLKSAIFLYAQIEQDVDPSQLSQCSPIFGVTASQYVSAKQEKKNPEVLRIVQEEIDTFLHKMCSSQSISDFLSGKDDPVPIIKESRHAIRCQLEKLVSMKGGNIEILETVYDNYVTFQCKMASRHIFERFLPGIRYLCVCLLA